MATYETNWLPIATTQQTAYDAIKLFCDGLDALGIMQTADTGQLVLTSPSNITLPTTAAANNYTIIGYQVRRLVSPGKPTIFLRVVFYAYPSTANTASTYRLRWTILSGAGTDGAGNVTVAPRTTSSMPAITSQLGAASGMSLTEQVALYMSSDGGNYLTIVGDPQKASGGTWSDNELCIERTVESATGQFTGDGYMHIGSVYQNIPCWGINFLSSATYSGAMPVAVCTNWVSATASLMTANLYPVMVLLPYPFGPMGCALAAHAGDATGGALMTTSVYGQSRNFRVGAPLHPSGTNGTVGSTVPLSIRLCYRYD